MSDFVMLFTDPKEAFQQGYDQAKAQAAAEIERLTAEVERLRAALQDMTVEAQAQYADGVHDGAEASSLTSENEKLRAALEPISRMKVFPDAATNQMTLATAIQIARNATQQGTQETSDDR